MDILSVVFFVLGIVPVTVAYGTYSGGISPCPAGCTVHGLCNITIGGTLVGPCYCNPGYTGISCESAIVELRSCANHTCQNGGTCVNNRTSLRCRCVPPYSGTNCESNCFSDVNTARDLPHVADSASLYILQGDAIDKCSAYCGVLDFKYAGIQNGGSCFCGNSYGKYGTANTCTTPCLTNPTKKCGGVNVSTVVLTNDCYVNTVPSRMETSVYLSTNISMERCKSECRKKGYAYTGAQSKANMTCFCGSKFDLSGKSSNCIQTCPTWESSQLCGGNDSFTVRSTSDCYYEGNTFDFNDYMAYGINNQNTMTSCAATCGLAGYMFGATNVQRCYCGDNYGRYGKSSSCNLPCPGDKNEMCGGLHENNVMRTLSPCEKSAIGEAKNGTVDLDEVYDLRAKITAIQTCVYPEGELRALRVEYNYVYSRWYGDNEDCITNDATNFTSNEYIYGLGVWLNNNTGTIEGLQFTTRKNVYGPYGMSTFESHIYEEMDGYKLVYMKVSHAGRIYRIQPTFRLCEDPITANPIRADPGSNNTDVSSYDY